MKRGMESLLDVPGCIIELNHEANEGHGEDAYGSFLSVNGCAMAVFDGCGGAGGKKYTIFRKKTGAYIASRECNRIFFRWYHKFIEESLLDIEELNKITKNLQYEFANLLKVCAEYGEDPDFKNNNIGGTIVKSFPTTASMILSDYYQDLFRVAFLWAGNSRGYFLDSRGLAQMTADDISGNGDAFYNLQNDAPLTNMLTASNKFYIHSAYYTPNFPIVTITATDGFFDSFGSPMQFEYFLLSTLMDAASYDQWRDGLNNILAERASDDYSAVIGCFGFADFQSLRNYLSERAFLVYNHYILPISSGKVNVEVLWQQYKQEYYRRDF